MAANINRNHFRQLISDREQELLQLKLAAEDAAHRQEEEMREQMLQDLKAMEIEFERVQLENERVIKDEIQKVNNDAAARVETMQQQMESSIKYVEDETIRSTVLEMEREWVMREDNLKEKFRKLLSDELEAQRDTLSKDFLSTLHQKDKELKRQEQASELHLQQLQQDHQRDLVTMKRDLEALAEDIWKSATEQSDAVAEEKLSKIVTISEQECQTKDDQIAMLTEERSTLQFLVHERERQLQDSIHQLDEMESTLKDVASEVNARHNNEKSQLSDEIANLLNDYDQLRKAFHCVEYDNDSLKEEVVQLKLKLKSLEAKCSEQRNILNTLDNRKDETNNRIGEISSCKQLLEAQLFDLKRENKELSSELEKRNARICELSIENKQLTEKASTLNTTVDDLREKNRNLNSECSSLKRQCDDTAVRVETLLREKRDYEKEVEKRIQQKDALLNETLANHKRALETVRGRVDARSEPVVVHLHGNNTNGGGNASRDVYSSNTHGSERLSRECDSLRSRVLALQRENYRMESELSGARQKRGPTSESDFDTKKLTAENNSLKQIIAMLRKEMENVSINNAESSDHDGDKVSQLSVSALEQQLIQCQLYLDLLLEAKSMDNRAANWRASMDEEVPFLQSKFQELHQVIDELRGENLRLRSRCMQLSPSTNWDDPHEDDFGLSVREQELIQKLEESTDEIESLLNERDMLIHHSNEIKQELQWFKDRYLTSNASLVEVGTPTACHNGQRHEQHMLDAILNDQSKSYDSESNATPENNFRVACIGRKPPLANPTDARPSKTAYGTRPTTASDRATDSQKQSFQKMVQVRKSSKLRLIRRRRSQ
eukprot:g7331.t1 g7331   contig24:379800-382481(+)